VLVLIVMLMTYVLWRPDRLAGILLERSRQIGREGRGDGDGDFPIRATALAARPNTCASPRADVLIVTA
jgi:hypothetical protein